MGDGGAAPPWDDMAREAAAFGPFFAFRAHRPEEPPAAPWRPMAELVADPGVSASRVEAVRRALAAGHGRPPEEIEPRVAASVAHLGLAARLVSPFLAVLTLRGAAPALPLQSLRWQPLPGSTFPLSLPVAGATPAPDVPDPVAALLDGPVRALQAAMARWSVSPRVLRGNVASAVNGAAVALSSAAPGHADRARWAAGRLLAHPSLRGTFERGPDGRFRRRGCCLIYRAAPGARGAVCGDCVLAGRRR